MLLKIETMVRSVLSESVLSRFVLCYLIIGLLKFWYMKLLVIVWPWESLENCT